jgi:DNA-binding transcriptional LysR family regulator
MVAALSSTLPSLEAFCRTYETGSFTKAARAIGVTPQATSRSIARLEEVLGVSLFRRSTRSLAPTDAARRYYEHCVQALALLSHGERELHRSRTSPEGKVRISVPTTYGHHLLLPSLGAFAERYPGVSVDVSISNQNVDLVTGGFDIAIRRGPIRDQSLVARKLGDFPTGIYASSAYLARRAPPKTPDDLAQHDCVSFVLPSTGRALPWSFAGGRSLVPTARYRCADDALGLITLARAGVGLIQTFDFLVKDDVERGNLVEVLVPHRPHGRSFTLLYPKESARASAVTAMIDFIVSQARRASS